jgi:hypothetical protein
MSEVVNRVGRLRTITASKFDGLLEGNEAGSREQRPDVTKP